MRLMMLLNIRDRIDLKMPISKDDMIFYRTYVQMEDKEFEAAMANADLVEMAGE